MDDDGSNAQTVPRIGAAHHSADTLLKAAKISSAPIRINDLVGPVRGAFNNLQIVFSGTKGLPAGIGLPDGVYALTHKYDNTVLIAYNENVAVSRQKFSVAHEFGHLYMGHLHGNESIDLDSKNAGEIEANQFAANGPAITTGGGDGRLSVTAVISAGWKRRDGFGTSGLLGWLALLGPLALFAFSLAPRVAFWEAGEMQTVPYILGIAHPTGFPLFVLG